MMNGIQQYKKSKANIQYKLQGIDNTILLELYYGEYKIFDIYNWIPYYVFHALYYHSSYFSIEKFLFAIL